MLITAFYLHIVGKEATLTCKTLKISLHKWTKLHGKYKVAVRSVLPTDAMEKIFTREWYSHEKFWCRRENIFSEDLTVSLISGSISQMYALNSVRKYYPDSESGYNS